MWEALLLALLENLQRRRLAAARAVFAARERVLYRTRDGQADYGFSIERQPNGSYRSYIIDQPHYARVLDAGATHRLVGENGRLFICWSEPLRTTEEARTISAAWADALQAYVRYGRRF